MCSLFSWQHVISYLFRNSRCQIPNIQISYTTSSNMMKLFARTTSSASKFVSLKFSQPFQTWVGLKAQLPIKVKRRKYCKISIKNIFNIPTISYTPIHPISYSMTCWFVYKHLIGHAWLFLILFVLCLCKPCRIRKGFAITCSRMISSCEYSLRTWKKQTQIPRTA
jgi:hypothetical protein